MSKSAHTPAPAPQPDRPADAPAAVDEADLLAASVARVEHRLRLLDELAEMAMKMARRVTEEAAKAADAAASTYAADDLAKLSRAVRLTLDLAGRLEESLRALRAPVETTVRAAHRQIPRGERASRTRRSSALEAGEVRVCEGTGGDGHRPRGGVGVGEAANSSTRSRSVSCRQAHYLRLCEGTPRYARRLPERLCKDLGLTPDWSRLDGRRLAGHPVGLASRLFASPGRRSTGSAENRSFT